MSQSTVHQPATGTDATKSSTKDDILTESVACSLCGIVYRDVIHMMETQATATHIYEHVCICFSLRLDIYIRSNSRARLQ